MSTGLCFLEGDVFSSTHYENLPMQYTVLFFLFLFIYFFFFREQIRKFHRKYFDNYDINAQNSRGCSNVNPQSMFWIK